MPLQFPDFQRISFDEANPWLVGAERGQKLAQSSMMFPQDMQSKILANQIAQVQAKYAEPMAKESLTAAQLQNMWNPKIWGSEIGLRGAQAGKLGKETQWYDKEAQARINLQGAQTAGLNAEAGMNQLKLDFLKSTLAGQQPQGGGGQMPMGAGGSSPAGMGAGGGAQITDGTHNTPVAGSGYSTPGISSPSASTIYGIDTPSLTKQDIANKMLLGIDTFSPRMENAKKQQQDQYTQYQKTLAETIQEANSAQKAKQVLALFNNAMDNIDNGVTGGMKGAYWGSSPSQGWRTMFHTAENVKNAQIADNAVSNLLPGAITELREAMKSGQFSVADLNAASRMKVSRTMDDDTRHTQTQWLNGIYDRFDEKAKFYTAIGNPRTGAQKANADMLWEQYQREFPLISSDGKDFQGSSLGNWPLYTTPRAIASIQATGTYKPSAAEKSTYMMKLPDGRVVPIKKGKVESAFIKGARPL
jgi:hypothetical protein